MNLEVRFPSRKDVLDVSPGRYHVSIAFGTRFLDYMVESLLIHVECNENDLFGVASSVRRAQFVQRKSLYVLSCYPWARDYTL